MNIKLLKELYKQAETECGWSEEKFAELIIRECSNVAWQHTPETEELEYSHLIKDKILERFGVE
jgi:hypothetical protein